jgi:zinc protease
VNQSTIRLVTLGTRRDNPDFYAITVMNEALGGGFGARLFSNIRSKQGLAYSVGGGIGVQFDYPGIFQLVMGTKSETTAKSVRALYKEIEKLKTEPFTEAEITKAKANILNSWIFNFDSKEEVLAEKMLYEFYGYPLDTLEKFRQGVEKTTVADVNRVVDKYIDERKFAVLVVGRAADFDEPLSTFGKVNVIDVAIPTAAGGAAAKTEIAAPQQSNPEGKALIAKVVQAMGGKEKLASIKAVAYKTDTVLSGPQGDLAVETNDLIAYPDRARTVLTTPMGEMTMVLSPVVAYRTMGGQSRDVPADERSEALKGLRRDPISIAQHADDPKYLFAAGGKEGELTVLDILADGVPLRWYVGQDGRIRKSAARVVTQQGPADRETTYSEFRDVDGVTLPGKVEMKENGQVSRMVTYKEITLNPVVDERAFSK